jgi:hypothetical protein
MDRIVAHARAYASDSLAMTRTVLVLASAAALILAERALPLL